MRLTYKYRLFPTSAQRTSLEYVLELCRCVYNDTLAIRKDAYENAGKGLSLYDTNKLLTGWKVDKPELRQVHSQVLQNVQERVDLAFQAFFRRVKARSAIGADTAGEKEVGYPRFRGKGWYDSFTFKQSGYKLNGAQGAPRLFVSKVGDIPVRLHRPLCANVKTLTVQRDAVGNWYACFSCEIETTPLAPTHKVVGVDLGLTTFAYMSDGTKIDRQRWMQQHPEGSRKDIARLQRRKEAFAKGTPERHKVIRALRHAYQRAANRRKNFAHQASRKLVNEYQFIAFEKLDIQEMQVTGNKAISRNIADVAWGQFVQFTAYKAANAGRGVALVNPRGTTQMCSGCGELVPKDLSVRLHDCPHCGLILNRDHNAALNILARGLASINAGSPDEVVEAPPKGFPL